MRTSPLRESPSPKASLQRSATTGRRHRNAENLPPNITPNGGSSLPPRPPASTGKICKRKLQWDAGPAAAPDQSVASSDSGVQVVVRVRPFSKKESQEHAISIISKIARDSLVITDQQYTFDAVATEESSQHDMFQVAGLPIVENCLAGFNSSIFAYGQTGSGKTYTMWGANNNEQSLLTEERGLTPRVFESLFARIREEETKNSDKQLYYQCRCSFLEIYNEQIADLLEPRHRNLQIREDVKCGVYVSNLTEEYVSDVRDVSRLLLKGLANRRIGATSMNSESSRSHTVFTCVLECRFKSVSDGMSSVRRSRINLVDLAGSERQKQSGAAGERLKEAGNINRSLSQLGNVINILAEVAQTGKQRHVPYRDSRLTFLLQESLGGNAKLAMICAISAADSCKTETTSTLRFAQRAKAIQNKAVVNEETTNDTTLLREQIRQLKDELKRMRSTEGPRTGVDGAYSTGWNARKSYNLLRLSLAVIPKTTTPALDSDSDEDMEIDDDNDTAEQVNQEPAKIQSTETEEVQEAQAAQQESPEKLPEFKTDQLQEVEELKRALEMAMTGHARLLEQYAELQDKHIALVTKQRKIREGASDVRQMGLKAGMSNSQLKWLESQAAQIVALNLEREQEREEAQKEMEFLQTQLQDTREAIQNAGELLARLKEAEEDAIISRDAAALAEQDAERLYREMEKMRRRHATEIATLQQRLMESRLRKSAACPMCVVAERVKFEFPEVDPETAQEDMETEEDAAALGRIEEEQHQELLHQEELVLQQEDHQMELQQQEDHQQELQQQEELLVQQQQQGHQQQEELLVLQQQDQQKLQQQEELLVQQQQQGHQQQEELLVLQQQDQQELQQRELQQQELQLKDEEEDEFFDDLYDGSEDRCNF